MWTPLTIAAAIISGVISAALILSLWVRHRHDTVLKRLGWSLVLLVPVIGWVFYGGLYRPPAGPAQGPAGARDHGTVLSIPPRAREIMVSD